MKNLSTTVSASRKCTYCGSSAIERIPRPFLLKFLPIRRYHCDDCSRSFYKFVL